MSTPSTKTENQCTERKLTITCSDHSRIQSRIRSFVLLFGEKMLLHNSLTKHNFLVSDRIIVNTKDQHRKFLSSLHYLPTACTDQQ